MKRILIIPLAIISLALAGCASGSKGVGDFISNATKQITNPVSSVNIYQVKNGYAAGLQLVADYRDYCWARPYAVLMADPIAHPICQNRRPNVRVAQSAERKAYAAIASADAFVRNNPTGNAVSYVNAAWTAVQQFQSAVPAVK